MTARTEAPAMRQVWARTADGTRKMGEPVAELWRANAMVGRLLQANGVLNAWHLPAREQETADE